MIFEIELDNHVYQAVHLNHIHVLVPMTYFQGQEKLENINYILLFSM